MAPTDALFRSAGSPALALQERPRERRAVPPVWVRALDEALEEPWDDFVAAAPDATLFHELAWKKAVERGYGHEAHYLLAGRGARITGVLPLFRVRGPFTGRALISVPYGIYGGILAQDEDSGWRLLRAAQQLADESRARYIELRQREPLELGLHAVDRYVTFRKEMPVQAEDVLAQLPRKARAAARQARARHGLTASYDHGAFETFYGLYVRSLRRLGSPPYSRRFLRAVLDIFGDRALVMLVRQGERPLAGVIGVVFRDEMFAYVSGADERFTHLQASNFMYLALMERTVELGLRVFDFGRTRKNNPGPYAFKCNQGFEPVELPYQMDLRHGDRLPNLTPSNRAFSWPRKVWQRLPQPAVRVLGSLLTKWIP